MRQGGNINAARSWLAFIRSRSLNAPRGAFASDIVVEARENVCPIQHTFGQPVGLLVEAAVCVASRILRPASRLTKLDYMANGSANARVGQSADLMPEG